MARLFFCLVPALMVFSVVSLLALIIVESTVKHALALASIFACAMFGVGWQITDPVREKERERAASQPQGEPKP